MLQFTIVYITLCFFLNKVDKKTHKVQKRKKKDVKNDWSEEIYE